MESAEVTFVLKASEPGAVRALVAAAQHLPNRAAELRGLIRDFELWLDSQAAAKPA